MQEWIKIFYVIIIEWLEKNGVEEAFFWLLLRYDLRYLYLIRQRKTKLRTFFSLRAARKYGLEILSDNIGPGLYLGHAHNINVHPNAVVGKKLQS